MSSSPDSRVNAGLGMGMLREARIKSGYSRTLYAKRRLLLAEWSSVRPYARMMISVSVSGCDVSFLR